MHQVVIDTNVLVSALRSKRGASYQSVRSMGQSNWRPNISVALALEYEEVLKREHVVTGLTEEAIDELLDYIFRMGNLIPGVKRQRPSLPDPDDERILE